MSDDAPSESQLALGRTIAGKWTLHRLLGTGGTASVYEAIHRNGKRVAIKLLSPNRAADARLRERFQREGYAANRVNHPRVVSVDDDGVEPDGTVFLVMDLLSGEPLDRLAERSGGKLAWPLVADIAAQLLEVLERAHALGIIHRDLKPANLFWSADGLRVLDFGLARMMDSSADVARTRDGAVLGTPAFMSPEQARASSAQVGPATDLWAVGATAFNLLTGRNVHEAGSVDEQIALAATQSAPRLCALVSDAPAALLDVFQRSLEHDPADRFVSARAMRDALRAVMSGVVVEQTRDPSIDDTLLDSSRTAQDGSRIAPHPGRKASKLLPALALVVVALVGWVFARGASPEAAQLPASASRREPLPGAVTTFASLPAPEELPSAAPPPLLSNSPRVLKPKIATVPSAAAPVATASVSGFIEQPPF